LTCFCLVGPVPSGTPSYSRQSGDPHVSVSSGSVRAHARTDPIVWFRACHTSNHEWTTAPLFTVTHGRRRVAAQGIIATSRIAVENPASPCAARCWTGSCGWPDRVAGPRVSLATCLRASMGRASGESSMEIVAFGREILSGFILNSQYQ
jgi:hypothetical protein